MAKKFRITDLKVGDEIYVARGLYAGLDTCLGVIYPKRTVKKNYTQKD